MRRSIIAAAFVVACAEPHAVGGAPPAVPSAAAAEPAAEREPEPPAVVRSAEIPESAAPETGGRCADTLERWTDVTGGATQVSVKVGTCSSPCRRTVRGEYFSRTHGTWPDRLSDLQRAANELDLELVEWTPQDDGSFYVIVECVES